MPGFLGGSSAGAGGAGGEITFPKEFVDPVTKLRVSNPQNLIDTDFEYGLQPTKWETVELINNTPSFFSKSGDTTIPNIVSITTVAGAREVIVQTGLNHNLDVGIPINVQGTKSVTADGAYIINSIPNETTFTYLARDIQPSSASIEDLYTSIITGEFFQGSQLRLAQSEGIVTDGASISTLTVTTESTHGFGVNTPFYFLNLNSTISQEFAAANTETKSFDSSNSATAQTFDGSNTLSSINIDWSNSATVAGSPSTISRAVIADDTIEVAHGSVENFVGLPIGAPLYYDAQAAGGFFLLNPRGVVFLARDSVLGSSESIIKVSEVPDGTPIDIVSNLQGTIQIANQARTFPGNNVNQETQELVSLFANTPVEFDGANENGQTLTVTGYSGGGVISATSAPDADVDKLPWHQGAMVVYETTGSPAAGLQNGRTYFVETSFQQGTSNTYTFTVKELPGNNSTDVTAISGGSGTQTFRRIDVALDKDIFHIWKGDTDPANPGHGFQPKDMVRYSYPVGGRFGTLDAAEEVNYYFVQTVYDDYNFTLSNTLGELIPSTQNRTGTDAGTAIQPTEVTAIGFGTGLTFSVTSGVLPPGLTLDPSTGVVSGTPTDAIDTREVVITAVDDSGTSAEQVHTYQFNEPPFIPGQIQFTSPGTFTWQVPYSTTMSAVAIGGGGGGGGGIDGDQGGGGGGGGGLRYINNYPMTAGENWTIRVGGGGSFGRNFGRGSNGGTSYIRNASSNTVIQANGGIGPGFGRGSGGGSSGAGGSTGFSGGRGGFGGRLGGGDGGGAANYSSNGSNGGDDFNRRGFTGQGTDLFGNNSGSLGGGGGGGNDSNNASGLSGQNGGVRIIWPGNTRQYPNTNVGNV